MNRPHFSELPWWNMGPYEVRDEINQRIMAIEAPTLRVYSVVDQVVYSSSRSTPIRIYTPTDGHSFPMILLIHGGAWVAGNLDTHDNLARYLCSEAETVVASVGYLNAPEGKFPLPLEQCYDALIWIIRHATEMAGDASRLTLGGDSAGGNMWQLNQ